LIGNALDAMQAQPLPELWLEGDFVEGKYRLLVRDNGHGIEPEARKHLFEPFFTTKPGEQGLGLGLTLSASLAAAAGGHLGVEHPLTGGTAFALTLPRVTPAKAEPI
ncbi:sensor histidine kinase, partial [Pseudomonas sp. MWU12-2312b]